MTSRLQIASDIIKGQLGYPVTAVDDSTESLYKIIGREVFKKDDCQKAARKELISYEERHSFYFNLFLPKIAGTRGSKTFVNDMKKLDSSRQRPSLREIYAASELLRQEIHLVVFTGNSAADSNSFCGTIIAPILTNTSGNNKEPLVLLTAFDQNGQPGFAKVGWNIQNVPPCQQFIKNHDHARCLDKRFRNSFDDLTDMSLDTSVRSRSIFGMLSELIYGDDTFENMVKTMVFDLQKDENNIEFFTKFLDLMNYFSQNEIEKAEESFFKSTRINLYSEAITRHMNEELGDGDLFAISSVFNIPTFVKVNEWSLYLPLTGNFVECFRSVIKIQNHRGTWEMVVPDDNRCLCSNAKPEVAGKLSLLKTGSRELIARTIERNTCCPGPRHRFHRHLKHINGSKTDLDVITPYIHPFPAYIESAINKLEIEERRLDQIHGGKGSLEQCLGKEIYGDENQTGDILENIGSSGGKNIGSYLQAASDWTHLTMYLLDKRGWFRFQPTVRLSLTRDQRCRYYTTLMYIEEEKSFVRIVPKAGCNCSLPPPLIMGSSLLYGGVDNMEQTLIPKQQRHKPMVTFLTKEPQTDFFKDETRCYPELSPYSEIRMILHRSDMTDRTLDKTEDHSYSLFRCISKEIFGTEEHFSIIMQEVVDEIKNNPSLYGRFVRASSSTHKSKDNIHQEELFRNFGFRDRNRLEVFKPRSILEKEEVSFLADRIKDGLELEDLELLAAASCFQSPIYVLSAEENTDVNDTAIYCSVWRSFLQLRRKRKPPNFSTLQFKSTCQDGRYYISLYKSFTGQFYRVCLRSGVCNCVEDPPEVPNKREADLSAKSEEDINFMKVSRDVEKSFTLFGLSLDNWIRTAIAMELLCMEIVETIEETRRNVNKASIAGASVGLVGSALVIGGIIAAPFTVGASLGLTIAGGVIGGLGGLTAAGSKITEAILTKNTLEQLDVYQKNFKERTCVLQNRLEYLREVMEALTSFKSETTHVDEFSVADVDYIPGLLRALKGFTVIPLCILRAASRGAAIAANVLVPLSVLLDAGILVISIYNLVKGSKTTVSEDLRKSVSLLRATRIQLQVWAYGSLEMDSQN